MALSNWDTLAVDQDGNPTDGVFTSPCGVEVALYKNWIYVRDKEAWKEGGQFIEDTVMSITEGVLAYVDVNIHAVRGPKDGIYVAVWTGDYSPDKVMVGIGCYGFTDAGKWAGIEKTEVDFLRALLDTYEIHGVEHATEEDAQAGVDRWLEDARAAREKGEDVYPDDHFFREGKRFCYRSYLFDDKIRAIDLSKASRFNQGDKYFADHIGTPLSATAPGEAAPTIMEGITEEMKRDPAIVDAMVEGLMGDEASGFPQLARDLEAAVKKVP